MRIALLFLLAFLPLHAKLRCSGCKTGACRTVSRPQKSPQRHQRFIGRFAHLVVADRQVGNRWLVSDGLVAGDKVVVEGSQKVKAGEVVQAQVVAAAGAAATVAAR